MTRQAFIDWAKGKGWTMDKHGHLQRESDGTKYRYKLSSIAVRYEFQIVYEHSGEKAWIRLRSCYFSKLSLVDGKLAGLKK